MDKISTYRKHLSYATLMQTLILFELILSIIFFILGHLINSAYIRGVGVGLIISWVTSAIAYFIVRKAKATSEGAS